jgi:D-alanyl-D-alanine dipeptidase
MPILNQFSNAPSSHARSPLCIEILAYTTGRTALLLTRLLKGRFLNLISVCVLNPSHIADSSQLLDQAQCVFRFVRMYLRAAARNFAFTIIPTGRTLRCVLLTHLANGLFNVASRARHDWRQLRFPPKPTRSRRQTWQRTRIDHVSPRTSRRRRRHMSGRARQRGQKVLP